jgi:predicted GIY-YIG superfamily endonuclease
MTAHCVYWVRHADHTDLLTQGYVGVTAHFERRMTEHHKSTGNRHLRHAVQKYGWDSLVKEQILVANEDYCLEIEAKLRPADKIGWNLVKGGGHPPVAVGNKYKLGTPPWNKGKPHSDKTKQKLSVSVAKLWENPEHRQRMSQATKGRIGPMKGKKQRPESIAKMRLSKIGKPSKRKGIPFGQEFNAMVSERVRLVSWECPHCAKFGYGKGAKNRWHFDNCKKKSTLAEIL